MKHFKTISEFHELRDLPSPLHLLISLINVGAVTHLNEDEPKNMAFGFYAIAIKSVSNVKVKYGQNLFDFNEGILSFTAPNQVLRITADKEDEIKPIGVGAAHPSRFFMEHALGKTINHYDFWNYALSEALFLSEKEEFTINTLIQNIQREYQVNIDKIIISHLESLLNYADRFYDRQFITREEINYQLLERLEELLNDYFAGEDLAKKVLPTVKYVAEQLNLSPKYLRNLLRTFTGQSTQTAHPR